MENSVPSVIFIMYFLQTEHGPGELSIDRGGRPPSKRPPGNPCLSPAHGSFVVGQTTHRTGEPPAP